MYVLFVFPFEKFGSIPLIWVFLENFAGVSNEMALYPINEAPAERQPLIADSSDGVFGTDGSSLSPLQQIMSTLNYFVHSEQQLPPLGEMVECVSLFFRDMFVG